MTNIYYDALMEGETVLAEIVNKSWSVLFDAVAMVNRLNWSTPFVPTTEEFNFGMLGYFAANQPELLE